MSLRIIPHPSNPTQTHPSLGAPSAPGVHDTLRSNLGLSTPAPKSSSFSSNSASASSPAIQSSHPLESRLSQWRTQQESLKMELLRRQFGLAEPVKRQMELGIVRSGEWRPAVLNAGGVAPAQGVHADILSGRDTELDWEDVFSGGQELREAVEFHAEMEGRFGVGML